MSQLEVKKWVGGVWCGGGGVCLSLDTGTPPTSWILIHWHKPQRIHGLGACTSKLCFTQYYILNMPLRCLWTEDSKWINPKSFIHAPRTFNIQQCEDCNLIYPLIIGFDVHLYQFHMFFVKLTLWPQGLGYQSIIVLKYLSNYNLCYL